MLPRVIRSLVFDLDGTLVHSLPGIAASLNRSLEKASLPTHPEHIVRTFIGDGIVKLVERAAPTTSKSELEHLIQLMKANYAKTWQQGTSAYPGVVDTLKKLADLRIPCAVFSNKPDEYCREITDLLFPEIHFTIVRGQLTGIPAKPAPDGAIAICEQLDTPTTQTALVGDSTIDLKTAKNADMISVAATWGYHDPPALAAIHPDHTITTIEQILPLLHS